MFTEKKTYTVVYTNFSSFIPLEHQFGLVYTLLHRCFCFATDMSKSHFEIEKLKKKYFYLRDITTDSLIMHFEIYE